MNWLRLNFKDWVAEKKEKIREMHDNETLSIFFFSNQLLIGLLFEGKWLRRSLFRIK
jgi:hypothetical protein